ncbi:MAG: undecaprenyl-diphosphate phosphatase [Magnetococcus sp. WYHC-3]
MDWIQAVVLALVQGITEFLPISSSGHLVLVPIVFGWPDQGLVFDIAANTGTLLAVMTYLRRDLYACTCGWWRSVQQRRLGDDPDARMAWMLILATIPVGLAGLATQDMVETVARHPLVIGTTSILFALVLWWADARGARNRDLTQLSWRDALVIGLFQAVALIPGTSRSGITMTGGLFLGLDRMASARFSFLLAVPVSVLAALLDVGELFTNPQLAQQWPALLVVFLGSGLTAFAVINWLMAWLRHQSMFVFVIYRIILGVVIFWLAFSHGFGDNPALSGP